jgi:hypothetical protein
VDLTQLAKAGRNGVLLDIAFLDRKVSEELFVLDFRDESIEARRASLSFQSSIFGDDCIDGILLVLKYAKMMTSMLMEIFWETIHGDEYFIDILEGGIGELMEEERFEEAVCHFMFYVLF